MNISNSISRLGLIRLLTAVLSIAALSFLSLELGAEIIGLYFLFQAVLGLISLLANFGVGGALIKRISEENRFSDQKILTSGCLLIGSSISVVSVVILISTPYLNSYFGNDFAIYLIPALIAKQFGSISKNILKAELKVPKAAYSILLQRVIFIIVSVGFARLGGGAIHLIYSLILSYFVQGAYASYIFETSFGPFSYSAARSLWDYAKYGSVAYVDSFLYSWVDVTLLGFFMSPAIVGIYEVAWRVSGFVILPLQAIEGALMPATSNWDSRNKQELIESIIPKALLGGLYFAIPSLFGAIAIGGDFLAAVFGSEFRTGYLVLLVLMSGRIVQVFDGVSKTVISGIDRPDLRAKSVIISIVLNICLNAALIPILGMLGAGLATVLSFTMSTILINYYLSSYFTLRTWSRRLGWILLSSIIMFVIIKYFIDDFESALRIEVMLTVLTGGTIYVLTTLVYRPIRKNVFNTAASVRE